MSRLLTPTTQQALMWLGSWGLVTLGQPSGVPLLCPFTALIGWAVVFINIRSISSYKKRFVAGTIFFTCIQAVQLFWLISHPYSYIIGVWLALSLAMGLQFGILSLLVTREILLSKKLFVLPALWTILEWSRLFWLSGFSFDPLGLALAWPVFPLQLASIIGTLGMSFLVVLINAFWARSWLLYQEKRRLYCFVTPILISAITYLTGLSLFSFHAFRKHQYDQTHAPLQVGIVHFNSDPEELQKRINKTKSPTKEAFRAWERMIDALAPSSKEKFDLIVLSEICVPFASSAPLFSRNEVKWLFWQKLGNPVPEKHNPQYEQLAKSGNLSFSSVSVAQALANTFNCAVLAGFEGTEKLPGKEKAYFNSAFFFLPVQTNSPISEVRYDKQILVPMGEYVPFTFAKPLAAQYGVFDSFSAGSSPKIFTFNDHKISPSICYEEIFSELMRKGKSQGATIFVNITDDYWYPNSSLARQHFEHARPRTVENGIPLVRSCNFGVSGAVNALGENIDISFGTATPALMKVPVSSYHYTTLYSLWGDCPLLLVSFTILGIFVVGIVVRRRPDV